MVTVGSAGFCSLEIRTGGDTLSYNRLIHISKGNNTEKAMAPHSSYSCLENPMDGGACWAAVHGVAKSQT